MLKFEDLIKGCISNDDVSKEMVYKSFYGYLMAVTLRYSSNRVEAEELVNDSFLKIFNSIRQFTFPPAATDPEKPFKAWIAKITSRTAIDFIRGKKIFLSTDDIEIEEPITTVNVITALNVKDILSLLNQLPELHRLVFNLYEIEGFAHTEISKLLNIPESSSRVYLVRAKQSLRNLYAKTLNSTYGTN